MVKQFCDNPYGSCQVRERGEVGGGNPSLYHELHWSVLTELNRPPQPRCCNHLCLRRSSWAMSPWKLLTSTPAPRWPWSRIQVEPGVCQALGGGGAGLRVKLQHRLQEVGKVLGILGVPLVLLHQHFLQAPGLQLGDVSQLTCRTDNTATLS